MRSFTNRLAFIAAILLITDAVLAAEEYAPSIKTTISRKRILIGDRIRYKAEVISRFDLEIEFPLFKDRKIDECEIKDSGTYIKRPFFGGLRNYTAWLDITSYYIGRRKIPQLEIKYRQKGKGNWRTLKTGELYFTVESVLPKDTRLYDIKDIKGPLYPFSYLKLVMWIIAGCAVIWLAIKILNKNLKKKTPPKLPHEVAIETLTAAQTELSKTGDVKGYYVSVSDAVRRYIETVFKMRAPEMTTQEFLAGLGNSVKLSADYKELLKIFMEACDLVKFAKHAPSREGINSVFVTAKKFIEETKCEYPPSQSTQDRQDTAADFKPKAKA